MSDHLPKYPSGAVTRTASATITGGQLVKVTGDLTVGPTAAVGDTCRGVANRDAVSGELLTVYPLEGVHVLTAAENITAGAYVQAGAAGKVALWENGTDAPEDVIGVAEAAVSADATGEFSLGR